MTTRTSQKYLKTCQFLLAFILHKLNARHRLIIKQQQQQKNDNSKLGEGEFEPKMSLLETSQVASWATGLLALKDDKKLPTNCF